MFDRKFFAFGLGPKGGIATNLFSSPFDTRKEAEDWARDRLMKTPVATGQIAIVETVAVAAFSAPPVIIEDTVVPAPKEPGDEPDIPLEKPALAAS